jgi:hypothetical protein
MSRNEEVEVTMDYVHHTDKALCAKNGDGEQKWLPLSLVSYTKGPRNSAIVTLPRWLAEKEGLV